MKSIAIIIDKKDFRDETYFIPKSLFEEEGIEVKTVSQESGMCLGVFGGVALADIALAEIKTEDFSALVFTKGEAKENIVESEVAETLIKKAEKKGIIVDFIENSEKSRKKAQIIIDKIKKF